MHSVLAPSSLARTVQCPGSVKAEAAYPEAESGPEAAEGEAAHWAGAQLVSGKLVDVNDRAPNGVVLTTEMVQAADMWDDYIRRVTEPYGGPSIGKVEQPVAIKRVHDMCWGTPDYRAVLPAPGGPIVFVPDFKYGHRYVDEFENWQTLAYAVGVAWEAGLREVEENVTVITAIVQPRAFSRKGSIREWRFKLDDVRGQLSIMNNMARAALSEFGQPEFRTGPECRDCRARHACTSLQRAAYVAVDEAGKAQPFDLSPPALAVELRTLREARDRMDARISGLEQQALARLRRGDRVPGLAVETEEGRLRWKKTDREVIHMGRMFSLNLAKPDVAITPLQALEAGFDPGMVAEMAERTRGAAKLVIDDGSMARRVFNGGTN